MGIMAHGIRDRAEKKEAGWDLAGCKEEPGISLSVTTWENLYFYFLWHLPPLE